MPITQAPTIEELSRFATETIFGLGKTAMTLYGEGRSHLKFDDSLVTRAEVAITQQFESAVNALFPEHQIYKNRQEEEAYTHGQKRYLWILDPLDGVANFQAGIPIWAISIALFENFWPIFGAVHMPATDDLFSAVGGGEALHSGKQIQVSSLQNLNEENLILTYSRFHQDYHPSFPGKIRNLGCTAAHMCYVAMGRADAAIISNESYQDMAAAQIILEAAGGKVETMEGGQFFVNEYLDGKRILDHLIAGPKDLFGAIRSSVKNPPAGKI